MFCEGNLCSSTGWGEEDWRVMMGRRIGVRSWGVGVVGWGIMMEESGTRLVVFWKCLVEIEVEEHLKKADSWDRDFCRSSSPNLYTPHGSRRSHSSGKPATGSRLCPRHESFPAEIYTESHHTSCDIHTNPGRLRAPTPMRHLDLE